MNLWFDLKYAWRLLLKTPGHSLLCTIVVALSVGLSLWTYVAFYDMALKPLPFAGSERWLNIQIAPKATDTGDPALDTYTYRELLRRARTVNHLGAFSARSAVLSEGQASVSLRAAAISPSLFAALQVAPRAGRLFNAADDQTGAAPVVILSFDTWQNYFAADPAVVGKQARIDGQPMQVVGVMPADFFAFQDFEVWLPLRLENPAYPGGSTATVSAFVALGANQSAAALLNEMNGPIREISKRYPELFDSGRHIELYPAHVMYDHDNVPIISTALFMAIAVLLLGCLNISMIFFARLLERSRELALRVALGSSRWRLLRQCLLESVFVVLFGLLIGIVLAELGIEWANGIGDLHTRIEALGRQRNALEVEPLHLLVAVTAAMVIWLSSTLIPAWRIAKQDAVAVLAGGSKGATDSGGGATASLLVGLQVAVSAVVLVACVNVVSAVVATTNRPTGLNTRGVMITTVPTEFNSSYPDAPMRLRYWDELAASIGGRIPGAQVAYSTLAPTGREKLPVLIENSQGTDTDRRPMLPCTAVSDSYFKMLGITLRSGRFFDSTDTGNSLRVAVVDENTAKRYWPGQQVLGKRIRVNDTAKGPWLTIVGVVSHVRGRPNSDDSISYIYEPLRQTAPGAFRVLVKLPGSSMNSRIMLRSAAFETDRDLPLHNLQMFDDYLQALDLDYASLGPAFSAIAAITIILAATGLYGLISRSVARRTHEVGIRRAMGGTQWQVTSLFLRQGSLYLCIAIVGSCLGLIVANVLNDTIGNVLIHVVSVTLSVFILIVLVIFVASYLPTRRAVALEPGDALRYE